MVDGLGSNRGWLQDVMISGLFFFSSSKLMWIGSLKFYGDLGRL